MNIVVFGSGNVATQLGKTFFNAGYGVKQVFSRNKANAQALASLIGAEAIHTLDALDRSADMYLLAVSDGAIDILAEQLPQLKGVVVHCSGATPLSVLDKFQSYGVIYPLQSISRITPMNITAIPFAVEGNVAQTASQLLNMMQSMAPKSFVCNTQQRLALHVAAVFANNFTNALFQISYDILQENQLSFDLLKPLILETAQKVQTALPKDVQTGPAKRSDHRTIQAHLEFLRNKPDLLKIYQQLTAEISTKTDS